MGMNPDTNRFEQLTRSDADELEQREQEAQLKALCAEVERIQTPGYVDALLRPDGSPVPLHWSTFKVGEHVVIKDYTFEVAYIGETAILFEPVGVKNLSKSTD